MLDATTKRNIDAARNVLVGKVPDPKAQVEQITTALIYKFMDDLDKESVEMGGKAKFFTGDFEKFSWTNVIDTRLTGEGRLDLYVQAITSMDKNPNLPQLFRDIFKGAFLPYNDPQTLSLFLKEINKFNYGHSEELGNAYEYLLSVLGSQGDAGQFRTPRHIIDFIVEVIDPKKNETILDPACGTAGFLISSYKHIRKQNSSNFKPDKKEESVVGETAAEAILHDDPIYRGDQLTSKERKNLMKNIQGYDISPDMVRLSLVNLYLHGFPGPKIFEYDTLSSEKRWGETFDVILANPPFMTPKGGIRPHKRFQVQANRSEVLFVDYILEHLNINGRAGIIVPEGIIFKTENAYKRLRKLLVEDGLFAVVSLPSGVFNPYSGVKTSILMFDNQVAKKTDKILFIKIENDGFGLGAQRRKIKKNDLPEALKVIQAWKKGEKQKSKLALWVKKEKIAEDGDYSLTGERYREVEIFKNRNWPMVELGEIVEEIKSGFAYGKSNQNANGVIHLRPMNITIAGALTLDGSKYIPEREAKEKSKYFVKRGDVLFNNTNSKELVGKTCFVNRDIQAVYSNHITRFRCKPDKYNSKFLASILHNYWKNGVFLGLSNKWVGQAGINMGKISEVKIPLPPLDVQKEIVEQIEVKQAAIDGAKAVIENLKKERRYFGHELRKMEDIKWVELGEMCKTSSGGTPLRSKKEYYENGTISWLKSGEVSQGFIYLAEEKITERGLQESSAKLFPKDTVLVAMYGATAGQVGLLKFESSTNQAICGVFSGNNFIPEFLYYYLGTLTDDMVRMSGGGAQPNISQRIIKSLKIPFISIDKQEQMVSKIEEEENIIATNIRLVKLMEEKIEKVIEEI